MLLIPRPSGNYGQGLGVVNLDSNHVFVTGYFFVLS